MSRIISYRGLLANSEQETIHLQTNNGLTGYRIVKFQVMGISENELYESSIQIWKEEQTGTLTSNIDFSDNRLLAAALYHDTSSSNYPASQTVIFDNEIFNQDIYITFVSIAAASGINYYIELQQMDLALDEATVATLKDIRNQ